MITMEEATELLNEYVQSINDKFSVYLDRDTIVLRYNKLVYDRICTFTWGKLDETFEINKLDTKASLAVAKTNVITKFYDRADELETANMDEVLEQLQEI